MIRKVIRFASNVKMTTMIASLVLLCVVASVAAVSTVVYLNLFTRSEAASQHQQVVNLGAAATIIAKGFSGSALNWTTDGQLQSLQAWSIPPFFDTELIDSVTQVTQQASSIYVLDSKTKSLVAKTTSISGSDGKRLTDLTITPDSPAFAAVTAKTMFAGRIDIDGVPYLAAMYPIQKKTSGELMGAIFVGTPTAEVEAVAKQTLSLILISGLAVTALFGAFGFVMSRLIARPIPRLAASMRSIADGQLETKIPYLSRGSEIGGMARAVEVFRENGLKVSQMTEAEAARIIQNQAERTAMMQALQRGFGEVVEAATAGDFGRRIEAEFADEELNALALSINTLVGTVDRGLGETVEVLTGLANADLTGRISGEYQGAFAELKANTNAVADKLTEVVGEIRHASRGLKVATTEILSGANDLSERTTRQAATIEETSAAMEQLASTVSDNAKRADQASIKAEEVTRAAGDGGTVMGHVSGAMERITTSSGRISNIIGLIDDVAFQTNLLALNASVEAARAGEAGKGFAVVAIEVRRLAQSAAQASSEVKALVEQSTSEVSNGSKLVRDAVAKLQSIVAAAQGSSSLVKAIAAANRDQAAAIEELFGAVRILDDMTQHNAALVEETNSAIEQTEGQASDLDRIVDVFTLDRADDVANESGRREMAA